MLASSHGQQGYAGTASPSRCLQSLCLATSRRKNRIDPIRRQDGTDPPGNRVLSGGSASAPAAPPMISHSVLDLDRASATPRLIRLSPMTPSPTQRFIPASPR